MHAATSNTRECITPTHTHTHTHSCQQHSVSHHDRFVVVFSTTAGASSYYDATKETNKRSGTAALASTVSLDQAHCYQIIGLRLKYSLGRKALRAPSERRTTFSSVVRIPSFRGPSESSVSPLADIIILLYYPVLSRTE
jgi:hypothetical protein